MSLLKPIQKLLLTGCFVMVGLAACSDNATAPEEQNIAEAEAFFTVSGAVSGEKDGTAAVVSSESGGTDLEGTGGSITVEGQFTASIQI